jgi:hypothetical protein
LIGHVIEGVLAGLSSAISTPPILYATYYCIDELSTPYLKIFIFCDMGIWQQLQEIEDCDLGLAEEGSHCSRRWELMREL